MAARYNRVQATTPSNGGTTHTFGVTPTPGNMIVVVGGTTQPTDNQAGGGNTYHLAETSAAGGGNGPCKIWYAYNIVSSGTFTITVTPEGAGDTVAIEWSGFGSIDPLQGSSGTTSGDTTHETLTASGTPSETDGVAIAVTCCSTVFAVSSVNTVSPAWLTEMDFGAFGTMANSRTFTDGVAPTITWTWGGGTTYRGCIAYFINKSVMVGSAAGAATVTAASVTIFEGGFILLEDGSHLLLEDGAAGLLESTIDSDRAGSSAGTATVSGVGAAIIPGVGSAAGSSIGAFLSVFLQAGVGNAAGSSSVSGVGEAAYPATLLASQAIAELASLRADLTLQATQTLAELQSIHNVTLIESQAEVELATIHNAILQPSQFLAEVLQNNWIVPTSLIPSQLVCEILTRTIPPPPATAMPPAIAIFDPRKAIRNPGKSQPFAHWQCVEVVFPSTADTDVRVRHDVRSPTPEHMHYFVVRNPQSAVIYHDRSATRKPWQWGHIILRSSIANTKVTLLLWSEHNFRPLGL